MKLYHSLTIAAFLLLSACATQYPTPPTEVYTQDNAAYFSDNQKAKRLIPQNNQDVMSREYVKRYYSPWLSVSEVYSKDEIAKNQQKEISEFKKKVGWGANKQPLKRQWLDDILANENFKSFPNSNRRAITVEDSDLRLLATQEPSYFNPKQAGEGYPFDRVQQSFISANTPVRVLQETKDRAWSLVLTPKSYGWIPTKNIAYVTSDFVKKWQTKQFVTATQNHKPIHDKSGDFLFYSRFGMIYPLVKSTNNQYDILAAVKDSQHNAVMKTATLAKASAKPFPVSATLGNFASLANELLDEPYGWGGIYGYRDCSATMTELFGNFGIYLPRDSNEQVARGKTFDLAGLNYAQKEQLIKEQGEAFKTLIKMPGHIMLYIGDVEGQPYVYHTMWALPTRNRYGVEGRAVVGKTVITPINFGEGMPDLKRRMLDVASKMAVIA